MLNKEEENRVKEIILALKEELIKEDFETGKYNALYSTIKWLAEKLKECNDELKEFAKELERNDRIPEVYKNSKNEISDRFYPR